MSLFRVLVVAVAAFVVMGAVAAFLVGVPLWAVLGGSVLAIIGSFLFLGRRVQRRSKGPETEV